MSLLARGSRILLPREEDNDTAGVGLSSGSSCLEQRESNSQYVPSAFVPRPPWRAPSAAELNILTGNRTALHWDTEADVAVVRMPDALIQPMIDMLEEAGIRESCRPEEYTTISRHPNWASNLHKIRE